MVGTDWTANIGNNTVNTIGNLSSYMNKKNKKTIRDRMETLNEDERKKVNKKMMETQFKTFLSDKKYKPLVV